MSQLRSIPAGPRDCGSFNAKAPRRLGVVLSAVALWLLLCAGQADAVLVASGNGQGNLDPPPDDPGWHHIGTRARNGMSLIYLGEGWVLTANHVGAEDMRLGGVVYRVVEKSARRITNSDMTPTDLLLYRVQGSPSLPPLPRLRIARSTPTIGEPVLMIGYGRNRGESVVREVGPGRWVQGWSWGDGASLRWGTNRVALSGARVALRQSFTQAIATEFQPPPRATAFEAQAARGDSGGAVFARAHGGPGESSSTPSGEPREWELVGVMFAVKSALDRKDDVSVFGSHTYAVDLAHYRDQILSIVDAPRLGHAEVTDPENKARARSRAAENP